ncbi:exodeoxyribonuclease V subunit gamma [Auraticoccus sp. F435]|uniref:RecBCD enzyme subunit RecC n=1 Tax=Auraticoccus cholistanensis TaxID=2656650 RepID=A0A6A9UTH8_9ACTN|nr:exodeoxyribonuclease V subunit gamma [Auraticoccus cholistanensis]MVA76133.1 exodeoxyribonuclease V subunit gamma [Auraticoccus cholistanensis]
MTQQLQDGLFAVDEAVTATTPCGASPPGGVPGLVVHRAVRGDLLADGLADLLRHPVEGADPFEREVVCVPTPGVERWLAQSLAERLGEAGEGVCAGIEFPTLGRLLDRSVREALQEAAELDAWHPRRLVWALLSAFDEVAGEGWFAPVADHLGTEDDTGARTGRRWATARRLARLFAAYAAERPAMLDSWAAGGDAGSDGSPVETDLAWQPRLWRAVAARVDAPAPPARLEAARAALRDHPERSTLPRRLSVFGPTRIDRRQLLLLEVLALHREVHLWLPHTSPTLWGRVAEQLAGEPMPPAGAVPRGPATGPLSPGGARHRLNQRLGRDQRELQLLLSTLPTRDAGSREPRLPTTLLGRLQADVVADRAPRPPAERPLLAAGDTSVQVHSSHGPDRQVEVLRDVLLALLAEDPTLEPRDIVVMCPDIETFAPLIQASFGLAVDDEEVAAHPGHRLRVRLADRSLRQVNPVLELLVRLLDLARSRAEAADLVDLAVTPAVARRFGFRPDDQPRLAELVEQSGIRWGMDHLHRAQFGMAAFPQNTWAAGLQRMLLGVAMSEDGQPSIGTVLPLDGVDSSEVELVGHLAELVSRVRAAVSSFSRPQTVVEWVQASRAALESVTAVGPDEQWQLTHAFAQLADLAGEDVAEPAPLLSPADFRAMLADELRGRPTRGNFRTGSLTMCTMSPMRSVPHRVVCLLGLDDGVFPRRGAVDGDDVLARAPMVGDRDRLSEDRQLLLDAVMAARETLVVVHSGADPRTNDRRPDAVPLRELLDALDETARTRSGPVSEAVRTRHPLQPFAPANFTVGPGREEPLSFDAVALDGARAAVGPRRPRPRLELAELPAVAPPADVELVELKRFLAHPAQAFLRARFGLAARRDEDERDDEMPISPGPLQRWAVGNRVLAGALQGRSWHRLRQAELLRGEVPPGPLGELLLEDVRQQIDAIVGAAGVRPDELPETVEAHVDLGEQTLTGAVGGVRGETVTSLRFSRLGPRYQLEAWLDLLLLSAAHPGTSWRALAVGKVDRWSQPLRLEPVAPERARQLLRQLLRIHGDALTRPAPLPVATAEAYARARAAGQQDEEALAQRSVESALRRDLEGDEAWATLVGTTLADLTAEPADPAQREAFGVRHRFGALALTVWGPLLEHRGRR